MERARKATLKMIAASDGAPQSASGYSFYLLAHAIATVLLLITLVAAIWQFMDWVASPSCDGPAALSSVASSPAASPAGTSLAAAQTASYRPARAEMARRSGDCPCPEGR
jgi:hypothetical protein